MLQLNPKKKSHTDAQSKNKACFQSSLLDISGDTGNIFYKTKCVGVYKVTLQVYDARQIAASIAVQPALSKDLDQVLVQEWSINSVAATTQAPVTPTPKSTTTKPATTAPKAGTPAVKCTTVATTQPTTPPASKSTSKNPADCSKQCTSTAAATTTPMPPKDFKLVLGSRPTGKSYADYDSAAQKYVVGTVHLTTAYVVYHRSVVVGVLVRPGCGEVQ